VTLTTKHIAWRRPAFAGSEIRSPACGGASRDCRRRSIIGSDDADRAALLQALGRELDLAVDQREQGVVAAEADARTRVEVGTALTHDDVASLDGLPP
jgi:hypothetical protein